MAEYYDGGHGADGPLVVFLHGAGCNHTAWRYQARYFANRGFRVMAFDLPAHGSNPGPHLTTVEAMAQWIIERLPCAGTVIGHSLGGLIALEVAHRAPHLVERIGLLACSEQMHVHAELQQRADDCDPVAIQMILNWSYDLAGRIGGHPEPGTAVARLTARLIECERANLGPDLRACSGYDGRDAAREVRVPALVIAGGRDRMVPLREVEALAASISTSRLVVVPEAGHFLATESPDPVRGALSSIVAGT